MTDPLIPFVDDLAPDVDLQKRMRDAQRLRVWRSLTDNYGKDPNKPAQAFNANLGPYVDDYIAQQEKMRRELVQATNRTALSPAASEWLSNPDYSRMSWDDVDRLVDLDRGVSQIVKSVFDFPSNVIQSLVAGSFTLAGGTASFVGGLTEQAIEIARTSGYSAPGFQKMLLEDLARQGFTSREIARIRQQITPPTQEEFISEGGIAAGLSSSAKALKELGFATSTFGRQIVTPLSTPIRQLLGRDGVDPSSDYGAILSGVQSIPAMVAFLPFYAAFGVHAGSVAFVLPVYGDALLQAENKGITGQTAHTYALGSAGIEYLTNIIPAGKFLADMKIGSTLLQRIKNQLPTEYVQENLATAFQDLLDMGVLYPEKTFEEYLRERPERAWHTILATTAGVVGLNSTIRINERLFGSLDLQQKRTRANDAVITAITEKLRDSKLQERSPKLAGLYADTSLRQHGLDRARIDAETLNQILEESGLREEFLQDFPGVAEQLNQNGTDPGTDVDMSTGAYASQVALNEKYADIASRMQPHLRLGSAEFSLAEESQIEAERQRIKKDAEDLARKQIEDAEENANQRQVILKELADFAAQMPGIRRKQASAAAEIAVTSWENLAKANNMKVGELWDLMKPVLVAGDITIPEMSGKGILFQDMTPEQESAYNKALEEDNITEAQRIFDESLIAADTHFTQKHTVFPAHIMGPWGRGPDRLMAEDPNLAYRRTSQSQINDMLSSGLVRARDIRTLPPSKRRGHRFVTVYWTRGTHNMSYRAGGLPGNYIIVAPSSIDEMSGGLPVSQVEQIWKSDGEQWIDVTEEIKPKFVVTGRPRRGQAGARISPEQDAAYMEAVESRRFDDMQAAVNRAAGVPDVFDAKDGYGAVPNNQEVDYRGFRAFLTPEQFRSLVPPGVSGESTRSFISEKLSSGEKIGQPFLLVDWDKENGVWRVSNHEGRSRSDAFADVFGQQPMEVHFFSLNARADSITPEMRVAPVIGQEGVGRLQLSSEMDARAIVRDADGNVIPLSQRFDVTQPSILYAPPTKRGDEYSSWAEEMAAIQRRTSGEQPKGALSKVADSAKEWLAGIRKKFAGGVFSDAFTRAERTGDVETGRKLVEAAAMQAGKFVFPANHGLREGILRGAEFDVSLLGKNTGAASAAQGVFTSKGRSTASYYALPPAKKSATPISNKDVNDRLSKALGKLIYERRSESGKTEVVGWWHFTRANMATKAVDVPDIIREYADYVHQGSVRTRAEALYYRPFKTPVPVIDEYLSPKEIVDKLEKGRSQLVLSASAANKENHKLLRAAARDVQEVINQVNVDYDLQPSEISATGEGGVLQLYVIFDNPYIYDQKGEYGRAATYYSIIKKAKAGGHDGVVIKNTYDGSTRDDIYVAFSPTQMKSAEPFTYDKSGKLIPLQKRFNLSTPSILYAPEADAGRRGAYEPRSMRIILTQKADATTLVHEFTHHYLHSLSILAHNKDAPEAITTQFQTLLDWFGVADVAAWDALPADQKAVHHEAFTYNFEQFIGTGKAPTKRLRDVFKRVAAWMRKIYGDIRGELNAAYRKEFGKDLPALTPEVREVFEAMLGAESNTADAAADLNFNPVFQSQEESGMNDEEWEAYNLGAELIIDEATSTLTASTARAMRWLDGAMARVIRAKTKQAKKERKAIRDRIKAEVEQQPVYRVINMLRRGVVIEEDGTERKVDGQHRLNAEAVKQMFPEDANDPGYLDLSSLRAGRYGMIAKDGIDPAVVADQFGYDSAAQMIRDLVAARPINDVINERTNKEIEKRHPELSPAAIKQAAMESLHNDAMSKFVATELRFLAGIQKPTRVIAEAARREAEAKIASLPYRSLVPSKFLTAERRAARVADQWMRSGDRVATAAQRKALTEARKALREAEAVGDAVAISDATLAVQQAQAELQQARDELADQPGRATVDAVVRAKWNQLYQGMLYREAVAARKKFDKHRRYLRRIAKDSKRKKILPEYADQIDYILRRLNISGVSRQTAEQMSVDRAKFLSWLEEQIDQNIEYSMSEGDLNLVAQRPIEDIPMESLDAIVDTIESIYHRGFVIRNGVVMQQKRRIEEAEKDAVGEINEHAGKERPENTTPATVLGRIKKSLYTFFNQHIKTAARARVIGGGKHGVFWNLFIRPANNQAAAEEQMIADLSQRIEGIFQPFYERGAGTMDSGKTMARRKFNKSTGAWENDPTRPPRSLTHEEVFVLALNLGNESNIQRVVDGFGITIDEARDITSSLSAGELRAVQQIWDLFAELKPQIAAMERRLYGKEPKWLTPAPIALQSSDGTTVELSGGYFPIKYDRSASELGMKIEAANEARAQLQGAFMGTQTRDSYKKTRADRVFGKPLLLQTSTLFNGLTEIVHDLSWREYIVDFNLLMPSDGAIPRAIIERYGAEWMQDIRQWVKDIAAAGPGPVHASEAWMQALRRSISISRLGFNPITGLLQGTGLVVTAQHTGAKHVADAMSKFMGDMDSARKEAIDKSPGMRNRFRTQFRELGEQAARIRGKSTWVMSLERAGYWGIITLQSAVDTITWHAGYSRAFEDNPNISEEEAAARAYQTVFDTQGSGNIINLSTIERGGPASQLLTVFYSWQNALFNELYVIAKTEGLSDKGVFRLATLAILLPFLTVAIRDIVPDDEEERRKRRTGKGAMTLGEQYLWATLKESINTIGGTMVGVREIAPTIASILSGERAFEYRGPTGFAPITDFIGTVRAGAESGIMSKRFAKQGMYFAGDILRLPSTQINRMIDGIDAMVEGKDVPWWAVVLGTQK